MAELVTIEVTRPTWHDGLPVSAGTVLAVEPLAAHRLLQAKRARLVHPPELDLCRAAARAELAEELRRAGPVPRDAPLPSPWRPR